MVDFATNLFGLIGNVGGDRTKAHYSYVCGIQEVDGGEYYTTGLRTTNLAKLKFVLLVNDQFAISENQLKTINPDRIFEVDYRKELFDFQGFGNPLVMAPETAAYLPTTSSSACAPFLIEVLNYLDNMLLHGWICRSADRDEKPLPLPPRYSDHTPRDFFSWWLAHINYHLLFENPYHSYYCQHSLKHTTEDLAIISVQI
ncbi:hypothetical protein AVEN_71450-1 [Araneus ventricosus]|uniref:Uncharacterized protein n=1 Tax=Araneus ventricosus TaxID=182803 RepID=A0A4Y2CVZ2_ARAVE|nr:hypothetical protein AVEN_71450-1 [Araneus ventricosus]